MWLSSGEQQVLAEQVELGMAVHRTLQQLELRDVPLGLSVAPRHGELVTDGGAVVLDPGGERRDGADAGLPGVGQPVADRIRGIGPMLPAGDAEGAHEGDEATDECRCLGLPLHAGDRRGLLR